MTLSEGKNASKFPNTTSTRLINISIFQAGRQQHCALAGEFHELKLCSDEMHFWSLETKMQPYIYGALTLLDGRENRWIQDYYFFFFFCSSTQKMYNINKASFVKITKPWQLRICVSIIEYRVVSLLPSWIALGQVKRPKCKNHATLRNEMVVKHVLYYTDTLESLRF